MRLSAIFERFILYLRAEKEAAHTTVRTYRSCFQDFMEFVRQDLGAGAPILTSHFTADLCRAYQHSLAPRELKPASIRIRLAVLGSFGKWAARHGYLPANPLDQITRPRRRERLPRGVPRWEAVEGLLQAGLDLRRRALLVLLAYGGLRRSEVVALNVGDVDPVFGLRRVPGKGGGETAVALPAVARSVLQDYLAVERGQAAPADPLFVVRYHTRAGKVAQGRMSDRRVWKIVKDLGRDFGIPELHPHAFRHACGAELLQRTKGNLRAVQAHLRHADIGTTTVYTRLVQPELQQIVSVFDREALDGVLGLGGGADNSR